MRCPSPRYLRTYPNRLLEPSSDWGRVWQSRHSAHDYPFLCKLATDYSFLIIEVVYLVQPVIVSMRAFCKAGHTQKGAWHSTRIIAQAMHEFGFARRSAIVAPFIEACQQPLAVPCAAADTQRPAAQITKAFESMLPTRSSQNQSLDVISEWPDVLFVRPVALSINGLYQCLFLQFIVCLIILSNSLLKQLA